MATASRQAGRCASLESVTTESNIERGNRYAFHPKIVGRDIHRGRMATGVVPRQIRKVVEL